MVVYQFSFRSSNGVRINLWHHMGKFIIHRERDLNISSTPIKSYQSVWLSSVNINKMAEEDSLAKEGFMGHV